MAVEIRVPQLGESVVEATISRWLKQEGAAIAPGDPLVELETDKVNVEVPAELGGVLQRIAHQEGETVRVGDVLAVVVEQGAVAAAPPQPAPSAATVEVPNPQTPIAQPDYGSIPAKGNGAPVELHADTLITPVARKLAEEKNVDLRLVKGSGPHGRITKEDVATFIERSAEAPATANALAQQQVERSAERSAEPTPAPSYGGASTAAPSVQPSSTPPILRTDGREERRRMSRRRLTIATRLVEAQHTAAMLTTFNEIDMTAVMDVRKRRRDAFKERFGVGLGFMSFFTKASVAALKAFPLLNAEIQGEEIVVKHYYDVGIAVSTEDGLVVPVLRDADQKSFAEIERDVADMATRAREGKLPLPELQGGTFTITNGGVFGSLMSTPILNAPQVGILGMHKIEERPVVKDGQIVARPMMYVALSYDHRIVDGSEAVRFLVRVKELIEDPVSLLVEG